MKRAGIAVALLWLGACSPDPEAAPSVAERLDALGYVGWAPVTTQEARRSGVVHHDTALAQPGLNLFSSRAVPGARLVNLNGDVVHEWHAIAKPGRGWNHVELAPGGDIIALERVAAYLTLGGRRTRVLGENVLRLTAEGEVRSRTALHDLLGEHLSAEGLAAASTPDPRSAWQRMRDGWRPPPADLFHANSIEILPRDVPGLGPAGAALVSLRNLDLVVVLDLAEPAVVWSLGPGIVERQHQASLLANDHLLVFDNGRERRYSRVVEIDPIGREVVWEYSGTPERSLRSRSQGGAEGLANGNVLVVESERGRAFEVTRDGALAWEFLHPRLDAARGARAAIYRMTRTAAPR
ncbi:MAG: hypothetical protein JRH16_02215 [Deltaproteobacteria bacterium]|nr:hypothetical protein [Deltaproteobacteria bacterium]